jgi:hypothetical protein
MGLPKMDNSLRSHGTKSRFRDIKPQGMSEETWGRVLLRVRTIQNPNLKPKDFAIECGMTPEEAERWLAMPPRVSLRLPD